LGSGAGHQLEARAELVTGHLRRLEAELDRTRSAVTSLRQLLRPNVEELQVSLAHRDRLAIFRLTPR
jgi:hypothetical protein